MSYKAFISYSHAADKLLAPTLQSALQRFAKPFYRLRALNVFRDKTSLHLTPELWPEIQRALAQSEYFILLASPEAANSRWVQMEVDEWLKLRGGSVDRMLIVQTDGRVVWDEAAKDFDWGRTDALPRSLRGKFRNEPFVSQLQWASAATDLSLRHPQFLDDVSTIAATLHGKPKDIMIGNDVSQHRLFKLVAAAVGVLLLAFAVGAGAAAVYANGQRKVAERQTAEAQRQEGIARNALRNEQDARRREQEERERAERAAESERLAKEAEEEQRKQAELATVKEKAARVQADEQRRIAVSQRDLAVSRELAAGAVAQLERDPELSVRLALHALDRGETLQAEDALRRALTESRHLYAVEFPHESPEPRRLASGMTVANEVKETRYSPDGRTLALASLNRIAVVDAASRAVRHVITGTSYIWCLTFSANSRLLATGDLDGGVSVWDVDSGESVRSFEVAGSNVQQVEFSPGGEFLLTRHYFSKSATPDEGQAKPDDREVARIWKVETGELVANLNHGDNIDDVAFDPGGHYVVTAGWDGAAKVWDAGRGTLHRTFSKHSGPVLAARFSRDGRELVTVDEGIVIQRWNVETGALVVSGGDPRKKARLTDDRYAHFSPSGARVVIRAQMKIVVYDTTTGREIADLKDVPLSINHVVFSGDERLVAFGGTDSTAVVWDLERGQMLARLRGHREGIGDLAFSPGGGMLITGGTDGTVRVWDMRGAATKPGVSHGGEVTHVVWDKSGRLAASGGEDGVVVVWDTGGNRVATLAAGGRVRALSFSGDGKRLLVARYEGAHVWDVSTGRQLVTLEETGEDGGVLEKADFSPDERIVIAEVGGRVLRWDAESGRRLSDLTGALPPNPAKDGETTVLGLLVGDVVLRGYSREAGIACVATEEPATSRVWDVRSGKALTELRGHLTPVRHSVMSADGRWIAFWNESHSVEVWNLVSGQRQAVIGSAGWTMSLEFNPHGTQLVTTGGQDGLTARTWDVRTGKLLREFRGHANTVEYARYSPDGRLMVTASADNIVEVWFAETGQHVATFADHRGMVFDARFSPDGRRILTASADGTARMLDCRFCIPLDGLRDFASRHPPRPLTRQERSDFFH